VTAVPAIPIYATHPRNAHTGSYGQFRRRTFRHLPHDLMTRNKLRPNRRQVAFNNVQVRAANSASHHSQQDVPGLKSWTDNILYFKEWSSHDMP
jgi:hypothetical protein